MLWKREAVVDVSYDVDTVCNVSDYRGDQPHPQRLGFWADCRPHQSGGLMCGDDDNNEMTTHDMLHGTIYKLSVTGCHSNMPFEPVFDYLDPRTARKGVQSCHLLPR